MRYTSVNITDDETGITASISPSEITINNSKKDKGYGYAGHSNQNFIFQKSKPEVVEKVANAILRIVDAQKKLNEEDFIKDDDNDKTS